MWKLVLFYLIGVPFGFLLYLLAFKVGLFSADNIIFYRGLKILAVVLVLHWVVMLVSIIYLGKQDIHVANAVAIAMTAFAINSTFLIVIPVTLDRSVSVFMLGYMNEVNRPVSREELMASLLDIYVKKYRAVDRRVDEQIESGNLSILDDDKIVLTRKGKSFLNVSKRIVDLMDIDNKFVKPKL